MPIFKSGVNPVSQIQSSSINQLAQRANPTSPSQTSNSLPLPGQGLSRYIHFNADQSGCGFWRMIWPANELLAYNKAVVMTSYQMVLDPNFYKTIDAVKLQRQCTESQYRFVKHLRKVSDEIKKVQGKTFKILWEVDDLVCPVEDIPDYNRCKEAFTNPQIQDTVKRIVNLCDEMTCVSERMADHYRTHISYDKISVIPNYLPKTWISNFYDEKKLISDFETNKSKGKIKIGYAGSGTHFDVQNKTGQRDDFWHVLRDVIKYVDDYEFVFIGGFPLNLRPYVTDGRMKFHPWTNILDYPKMMHDLDIQVMIAPLATNSFTESKSDIKMLESYALGRPCICQDLPCYSNAFLKFKTGDELFDQIKHVTKDLDTYLDYSRRSRNYTESLWLNDHLDEFNLVYNTPYGDESRKLNNSFLKNNAKQFNVKDDTVYYV